MWAVQTENIVQSQESHRSHSQGNRKQEKNIYKHRVNARKHAFLIIGLLVEKQRSPLRVLGHKLVFVKVGCPVFKDGKTQARI